MVYKAVNAGALSKKLLDPETATIADIEAYTNSLTEWNLSAKRGGALSGYEPTAFVSQEYLAFLRDYIPNRAVALTSNSATVQPNAQPQPAAITGIPGVTPSKNQ